MSGLRRATWLQFRLSTAIVVSLVAAVLLGLNTLPQTRTEIWIKRSKSWGGGLQITGDVYKSFGWPVRHSSNEPHWHCMTFWSHVHVKTDQQLVECLALPDGTIELDELSHRAPSLVPLVTMEPQSGTLSWENAFLNLSVAMAILFATAMACERFSCRREKRMSPLQGSVA